MADLDSVKPTSPLPPLRPEQDRREQRRRPAQRDKPPRRPEGLTDDQGERGDDDPSLIDDYA